MSFLEKEEGKESSSKWDWVIMAVVVLVLGLGTFVYQYQKGQSTHSFESADSLYQDKNYVSAESAYEALKAASYITPQDDSVIYSRLDTIQTLRERDADLHKRLQAALKISDTTGARDLAAQYNSKGLLPQQKDSLISYWESH